MAKEEIGDLRVCLLGRAAKKVDEEREWKYLKVEALRLWR